MEKESSRWFRQASADLKAARDNLDAGHYYLVAQLCHQAVEKSLKALYIRKRGRVAPRTHNLKALARNLSLPDQFDELLSELEPAYMLTRYPDAAHGTPVDLFSRDSVSHLPRKVGGLLRWTQHRFAE